jgi:hypothetical protein
MVTTPLFIDKVPISIFQSSISPSLALPYATGLILNAHLFDMLLAKLC